MAGSRDDLRVWQRAAALGSLWAAVEIVVGSFLHNLGVPFSGSVLAAFGVIVMTAGHRASPARGVIWRAALITALMKSVSPSAVILGPMVGILMEGLLLEASVRLLGATRPGYLLGGALAVSWSLAQKIVSALIAFGPDLVRLYVEAYAYASKSLGVSSFGPFDLVVTLFVVECVIGGVAAGLGLRLASYPNAAPGAPIRWVRAGGVDQAATHTGFAWSIPRLAAFAAGLVGGMALVGSLALPLTAIYVAAYAALVFRVYPRALARLMRPMFWIQVGGVLLLAGLLLGSLRSGTAGLMLGLAAGAQMALRATLVVLGFTAVSVELRNPRILGWLERRRLRGLSDALGLAFGALPAFTAALADQRRFWRRPLAALSSMVELADGLYASRDTGHHGMIILAGETGAGKTTRAAEVVEILRQRGVRVAGVLAKGLLHESRRSGFDIVDLSTGRTAPLCRESAGDGRGDERWGRFAFSREGLRLGHDALAIDGRFADVVVIDEIGPLELAGGGWAESLDALAGRFQGQILVVARIAVVEAIRARWGDAATPVCDVARDGAERIAALIVERLAAAQIGSVTPSGAA